LGSGRVYVNQAIEHIKLTRSLLNYEYNVNEIDDECQAIDDEWVEFISDFDDQKQELERLDLQFKDLDQDINRFSQSLKGQETAFQSIIGNQSTLELKLEKLEQLQVRTSRFLRLHSSFFRRLSFKLSMLTSIVDKI
jgi:chromosome segregation ATPase